MSGFYMEGFAACKFNSGCLLHEFLFSRRARSSLLNESNQVRDHGRHTASADAKPRCKRPVDFNRLFTDSKFLDDVFITLGIVLFKIVQQAAALADHHKKTAPGGMVFFVVLEVLRQLSDTFTQNSNLYFRAAGI